MQRLKSVLFGSSTSQKTPPQALPATNTEHAIGHLRVRIYQQDITSARVDCIVNAANKQLQHHKGQVSFGIAQAAGRHFEEEGQSYVAANGHLQIGSVWEQRAEGSLCDHSIRYVLHAVCPHLWASKRQECLNEITQLVLVALDKADKLGCISVAFPALSTGLGGVPFETCVEAYYAALAAFTPSRNYLQEVHFVFLDDESTENFDIMLRVLSASAVDTPNADTTSMNGEDLVEQHMSSDAHLRKSGKACSGLDDSPDMHKLGAVGGAPACGTHPRTTPTVQSKEREKAQTRSSTKKQIELCAGSSMVRKTKAVKDKEMVLNGQEDAQKIANVLDDECSICLEPLVDPQLLPCGHKFCSACVVQHQTFSSPLCPTCRRPYAQVCGNQPEGGTMNVQRMPHGLPGYEGCGTISILYCIPSGTQRREHPRPGEPYHGAQRTAFLPDNDRGRRALELLRKAFEARLIFTVGTSITTGRSNVVVWNDIHHKTSPDGGPTSYGYPDPDYLDRLEQDLAAKGIL